MLQILQKVILCATLAAALTAPVAAFADEMQVFAKTLYPFMRQNCVQCHGEQAIYPVGPSHTHSDMKIAFKTFSKFINYNDITNSRFIKFASNKHFCLEYDTHCDKMDAIVVELTKRYTSYATQAKTLTKTNMTPGTIVTGNTQTITQLVKIGGASYTMTTVLKKFSDDYRKIVSIHLQTNTKGAVGFDGIDIYINGQAPQKATGLKNFSRKLNFENTEMVTRLTASRETIVNLKDGESINIKLLNFRTEKTKSFAICDDKERWEAFVNGFRGSDTYFSFRENTYGSERGDVAQSCNQIMLQIDESNISQSILLQQAPKTGKKSGLASIKKWIIAEKNGPEFKRQNIEAVYGNYRTTCFQLADKSYTCFGEIYETYSGKPPLKTISGIGTTQFALGTRAHAHLNAEGNIVFSENRQNTFPQVAEMGDYTPPAKITELKVGYEMTCFLTVNKDVYCGGGIVANDLGIEEGGRNFIKISTVPIKSISMNLRRVFLISETNDLYFFGTDNSSALAGLLSGSNRKVALQMNVGFPVADLYQGFSEFCLKDMAGAIHCYGDNVERMFNSRNQGDIIQTDLQFKQFEILSTIQSACGLVASGQLYCSGTFPGGLRSENEASSSNTFVKIKNAPANIKFISSSDQILCMVTTDNLLTFAGDPAGYPYTVGLGQNDGSLDPRGRPLYQGPNAKPLTATISPYIALPIR